MNIEVQRARRRQMFIFLLVFLGIGILLARLYYWQVLQSQSATSWRNALTLSTLKTQYWTRRAG